ncbi:hypothetical protein GQ457_11G016330 [Hibiscus cannabinus]
MAQYSNAPPSAQLLFKPRPATLFSLRKASSRRRPDFHSQKIEKNKKINCFNFTESRPLFSTDLIVRAGVVGFTFWI